MDIYRACDRVFLDTARPFTPRGKAVNQSRTGQRAGQWTWGRGRRSQAAGVRVPPRPLTSVVTSNATSPWLSLFVHQTVRLLHEILRGLNRLTQIGT